MFKTPTRQLTTALTDLREKFTEFTEAATALSVRRSHLAPTFMRLFNRYRQETGRTFIAFVKELDPSVPSDRAEYPKHRSYQAALYLRRLVDAPHTTVQNRKTASPYEVLVPVTKSLMVLHPHPEAVWMAIQKVSRWDGRSMDRLREHVNRAKPIVGKPGTPRLVKHGQTPIATAADRGRRATEKSPASPPSASVLP
jgi:hypothetical protein